MAKKTIHARSSPLIAPVPPTIQNQEKIQRRPGRGTRIRFSSEDEEPRKKIPKNSLPRPEIELGTSGAAVYLKASALLTEPRTALTLGLLMHLQKAPPVRRVADK